MRIPIIVGIGKCIKRWKKCTFVPKFEEDIKTDREVVLCSLYKSFGSKEIEVQY